MPKILVVEDNKDTSFMICEILKYHIGCQVITAIDGEECLRLAKDETPDVILLDINMPGLDGFEVCQILKRDEYTKQIPIILLTATLNELNNKIKGLEIGADDYLVQPIDNIELITRVKVMLRIKRLIEKAYESEPLSVTLHDLKSPLNTIIGFSDLLASRDYGPLTPKQKEFIGLIHQSANKLLSIVKNLSNKQG